MLASGWRARCSSLSASKRSLAVPLAGEELDDRHARERLLQVGVEARQPVADEAVAAARGDAEEVDRQRQHRHQREGDEREVPIDRQHDGDDAEQRGDVHEDRQRAGGEHLVDHVDVGGQAGHQPADRIAIEEARRQLLQVRDEVEAQIGEALLRHEHHQVVLQIEEAELGQHGDAVQAARCAARRRGRPAPCSGRSRP